LGEEQNSGIEMKKLAVPTDCHCEEAFSTWQSYLLKAEIASSQKMFLTMTGLGVYQMNIKIRR